MLSYAGTTQILIQLFSLISGILIVRMVSTEEYAWYTVVNGMLGMMSAFSDGGITTGVMAIGGRFHDNDFKLGIVINTGMTLRRKFSTFILLVFIPIIYYLLLRNGASHFKSISIVLVTIPLFLLSIDNSLLESIPKLKNLILELQTVRTKMSFIRCFAIVGTLVILPYAALINGVNALVQYFNNKELKRLSEGYATCNTEIDNEIRSEILKLVKRSMPGVLYMSFAGQIQILIMSFLGTTKNIASLGAISRVNLLLAAFSTVFATIVGPTFSRYRDSEKVLSSFIKFSFFLLIFSVILFSMVSFFSREIVFVLGEKYLGMESEMSINFIAGLLSFMAGCFHVMYSSRGYVIHPVVSITVNFSAMVLGLFIFDFKNLNGVIAFSVFTAAISMLEQFVFSLYKFRL